MLKKIIIALVILLFHFPVIAQEASENDPEPITIGEKHSIDSKVLGEERPYWIYLPESYNDTTYSKLHYPVLYLLDGDAHFHTASGVVRHLSSQFQIPEMVIVALPNTNRTRDLTPTHSMSSPNDENAVMLEDSGGADAFLEFIRDELFPEIESTYRTQPYRILTGHSFGGLFALHALLDAPGMFQSYIAIDPSLWWDDQLLVHRADSMINAGQQPDGSVYISLANEPDLGMFKEIDYPADVMFEPVHSFTGLLESEASADFRPKLEYFEAEDHNSVTFLSFYHGLRHIFDGYNTLSLPNGKMVEVLEEPSVLNENFEEMSERLGIHLVPPKRLVQMVALYFIGFFKDADSAIQVMQYSPSLADHEYRVYNYLGWAYTYNGEDDLAINAFEKALELNPDNEYAKMQLNELRDNSEEHEQQNKQTSSYNHGQLKGQISGQGLMGIGG
jgi:uncharacterized protein